jgi:UDP-N-acetylglucosamine acyltransferase
LRAAGSSRGAKRLFRNVRGLEDYDTDWFFKQRLRKLIYRFEIPIMRIHPLALVASSARLGDGVQIGPFCVVENDVTIGPRCILENHVVIKSGTTLGEMNHLFEGAVVGGIPQHTNVPDRVGQVVIGSGNTIRENVTIHKAMQPDHNTVIGDHCLLMCNAHVAHDCHLADHVILTNNVMLAGHVTVGSRAFLSGGAGVHQFCRVGTLAMVGGLAHISRDVPPFVTIDGQSSYVVGLNQVGLRRAGHDAKSISRLKEAYRVIYRSGLMWKEILAALQQQFHDEVAAEFFPFLASSKRGIIPERRMPPGATIRIHPVEEQAEESRRAKAG